MSGTSLLLKRTQLILVIYTASPLFSWGSCFLTQTHDRSVSCLPLPFCDSLAPNEDVVKVQFGVAWKRVCTSAYIRFLLSFFSPSFFSLSSSAFLSLQKSSSIVSCYCFVLVHNCISYVTIWKALMER